LTPRRLSRFLGRAALGVAVRTLVGVALVGGVVGLAALAGRPEAWAGGLGFVVGTAGALAGTSVVAALVLGGLVAGFLLRIELGASGFLAGFEVLGLGPGALLRAAAPALVLWTVLVAAAAFIVEPAAWTAVHSVKGSPAVSAAALGRLAAGEVVAVPGGALAAPGQGLAAKVGELEARAESWAASGDGWVFGCVVAQHAGSRWEIEALRLRPVDAPSPPRSPWTKGWGPLRAQIAEGEQGDRARFVWHRRHALVVVAPFLAVVGFVLGPRRRAALGRATLRAGAFAASLFVLVRVADGAGPLVGGWAPAWLAAAGAAALRVVSR